ncbi:MAG TPA: GAF and ANTAR domain-containing protein [Actinotalea sp.]|jgi:hypothetical protein
MAEREGRERAVRALIDLEPTTADPEDRVTGWLQRLCAAAVRALPASGAGVSVVDRHGVTELTVASDPECEYLEELQFTLGEGPCVDALAGRRPVLEPDVASAALARWPMYAPAVLQRGVRAVFAFPLQVGAARLGVLDVYRRDPAGLDGAAMALALTFADVTVSHLLDAQAGADVGARQGALDEMMSYRTELYQAQGIVTVDLGISVDEAMVRLRAHAFAYERRLGDIARDVVAGRLRLDNDAT